MTSPLDEIERETLEDVLNREFGKIYPDSDEVIAVVEAILLARKLRAQSPGTPPSPPPPRLRTVPPND